MTRFLISTTEEMQDILKSAADERGQTLNGLIRQILWDWVERKRAEQKAEMKNE